MDENFDCTQFFSFDTNLSLKEILLLSDLKNYEFLILKSDDIREVKKRYLEKYMSSYLIELKNDNFIGDLQDWSNFESPPIIVEFFSDISEKIAKNINITNYSIILCKFAQENVTEDKVLEIKSNEILPALYNMSKFSYDLWMDNLILKIQQEL